MDWKSRDCASCLSKFRKEELENLICIRPCVAIKYAIKHGVDILNLSFGYYAPKPDTAFQSLLLSAKDSGILIVTSAGNDGLDTDRCRHWPSGFSWQDSFPDFDHIISVAALREDTMQLARFSNYGQHSVQLAAPGTCVFSSFINHGCGKATGTSMAAPFVSRLAAILKLKNPLMDHKMLKLEINNLLNPISSNKQPNRKIPSKTPLICP